MHAPLAFASLLLTLLPAPLDRAAELQLVEPLGEWAGWLYMDDGDVPVRVHVTEGALGYEARVDLPAAGQIDTAFGARLADDGRLVLGFPSADDAQARLELGLEAADGEDDHLRGSVEWFGVAGRVELHRAAGELAWQEPGRAAELVGIWGEAPGLVVRQQPWGELILIDPVTGAERTLFPRSDGSYVVGPALYVPAPVERELRVERDEAGSATALVQRDARGELRLEPSALRRETLVVERDGAVLEGTLTLPDREEAPCVVLAGGASWRLRGYHESYALLLAAHGVASVAYDKRGNGASGGASEVPFATTAADLRAFADAARAHPGIAAERVGFLGISRGGWYGALAAAQDPRCAFFLDVVGPAVSPIEQETSARLDRMRERGADEEQLSLGERYLRTMWRFARRSEGGQAYLELREAVRLAGWLDELQGPEDLEPGSWEWLRSNGDFDPKPSLRSLRGPVLALFGEADLAVAARINAPLARDALWASEAEPTRVLVLPGCDHSLRPVVRGPDGRRLPPHRSGGVHPEVWKAIGAFLAALR